VTTDDRPTDAPERPLERSLPVSSVAVEWLNYHHLLYFWTVVREGGVARASRALRLAQPTISGQVRALENALGVPLLERRGRQLVPTDTGQMVFRYADEIFGLGRELQQAVRGLVPDRAARLVIGINETVPKIVTRRVLEPILSTAEPIHLVVQEGRHDELLAELARYRIDVILSDGPVGPGARVRAFAHALGESGMTIFGTPAMARKLRRRFPDSLDGAPFLVPDETAPARRALEEWFRRLGVAPRIRAEIGDSALIAVFGSRGLGLFAAPTVVEAEVRRQYGAAVVGRTDAIVDRYYLISGERRLRSPAVVALSERARERLFATGPGRR
jgi:LysR family transcriptional regulator, transcriptional activator of nhaA